MKIPQIKISVKKENVADDELYTITSSKGAEIVFREIFDADTIEWTEESIVLCLNQANKVIAYYKLSSGGITGTIMDPRVVFTIALKSLATSIIVAHNHPSGNLKPSDSDRDITKKLKNAGSLLDIQLLDHLIITKDGYTSFADEGWI